MQSARQSSASRMQIFSGFGAAEALTTDANARPVMRNNCIAPI